MARSRLVDQVRAGESPHRWPSETQNLIIERARIAIETGSRPLVAICMATFNPEPELIRRQLDSIRSQSHRGWICLISDDASEPERVRTIREAIAGDPRFVLCPSDTRRGRYANFERALRLVPLEADQVALSDQGDEWLPEKLGKLIDALAPDTTFVYAGMDVVREDGTVVTDRLRPAPLLAELGLGPLLRRNRVLGSAALFRAEVLDVALPFPAAPGLDSPWRHDHWLAVVAAALGYVDYADRVLSHRLIPSPAQGSWRAVSVAAARAAGSRSTDADAALAFAEALRRRCGDGLEDRKRRQLERARRRLGRKRRRALPAPNAEREAAPAATAESGRRLAVQVTDLEKRFALPGHQESTLKGRLLHPFRREGARRLVVLDRISFEVDRGEFFGVVGRNGSGKSTLLKLLAGIYRADGGRIRVAPRVAPIIELGIGFQPELAAKDNVVLNAEMMGVPGPEALARFEDVLAFAELEEFADLKLKNYSSGMRVRLAFAIALLTDADLYLFDEVLAVGDAGFQRKCWRAFQDLRRDDSKTVVLVTHAMTTVERFCDRALLLEAGGVELIGDPREVAQRYTELLLEEVDEERPAARPAATAAQPPPPVEITSLWVEGESGEPARQLDAGDAITLRAAIEAGGAVERPALRVDLRSDYGARIFYMPMIDLSLDDGRLAPGDHVDLELAIENKLVPGRYTLTCALWARGDDRDRSVSRAQSVEFMVPAGGAASGGVVALDHQLRARRTGPGADAPARAPLGEQVWP